MTSNVVCETGSNMALGIEYDGQHYRGWQRQQSVDSVQARIEDALQSVCQSPVEVICAGRTDAGVHATGQIVNFKLKTTRPIKAFTRGMNTLLPNDIAVRWAKTVSDDFHARYSAKSRRYRYVIFNNELRGAILNAGVTHVYQPLDAGRMHQAAQCLVGEHDFTSFRASLCQSKTPFREIHEISVTRINDYIVVEVKANAFLHHMVRNIVGSLIVIGHGEQAPEWMFDLLVAKDRKKAAATAKPNGLYLVDVEYPSEFELPVCDHGPLFLSNR